VKFVICDREDYRWARGVIGRYRLDTICEVLFSPSHGQQDPAELAQWILDDHLPVRLQLQLHKQLWGDARGR
jgi:7-carboxy-7-deazaguanine synthase